MTVLTIISGTNWNLKMYRDSLKPFVKQPKEQKEKIQMLIYIYNSKKKTLEEMGYLKMQTFLNIESPFLLV